VRVSDLLFSVFSDVSKYRDPLHTVLDYIAEVSTAGPNDLFLMHTVCPILIRNLQQASDCDMVLTHDDDLLKIDGLGHGSVS
jgi:hypothetical protein